MIDRESLRMALECATKINDDGKAETVIADSAAFLRWMEEEIERQKQSSRDKIDGKSSVRLEVQQ